MAIDPNPPSAPINTSHESPIENEIPEYRAINGGAVSSFVMGLVAILSFVSLYFLVAAAAAVLFGGLALRKIRRNPNEMTGAGLANVGILLGLIFGLSATTVTVVRTMMLSQQATQFAGIFAKSLEDGNFATVVYWQTQPRFREGKSPAEVVREMQQQSTDDFEVDPRADSARKVINRLEAPDQYLHVQGIEAKGFDGLDPFAYVLLHLHGSTSEDWPAEEYAMIEVRSDRRSGSNEWWVQSFNYPYEAGSASRQVQAAHTHADGSSH